MSFIARPKVMQLALPSNELGLTLRDYEGGMSTLCAGCGHESVSSAIAQAFFELSIAPHRAAKLSGIGCSSKTPAYFMQQSHGMNAVHGRMPAVATGASAANRDIHVLGVSGDGDSLSIGLAHFVHAMRRNLEHGLHPRKQWRIRPHQRPVFGFRRRGLHSQGRWRQQSTAD